MRVFPLQPWRKITELTGGKGVLSEWRGFPNEFLQITQEQALAIPCGSSSGCYMNVVKHEANDLVGICTAEPRRCDKRALTKSEVVVYNLNNIKLFNSIAEALSFTVLPEKIADIPSLSVIGNINPQAELKFPVFIFLGQTSSQVDKTVSTLCMNQTAPFLLILPFGSMASHTSLDAANKCKSKIIGLDDIFEITNNGNMRSKKSINTAISNWLEQILPQSDNLKFPTPAGTHWNNITITFISRDIISIKCGESASVNYERLHIPGMFVATHREKKPTDKWFLLMAFALWGPNLNMDDLKKLFGHDDWDRMRTQKSQLSKSLKDFFGIKSDPISYISGSKEYQPNIIIRQDENCDLTDWINDIHK